MDTELELRLAAHNAALAPDVVTVLVAHTVTVSSTSIKALAMRGEPVDGQCSPQVAELLAKRVTSIPPR